MRLYNTLTGAIEEFKVDRNTVNMYVCGITPYAPSHLGHAMCAVVFDTLRRYMEYKGYLVNHIQNFTDIDDKMISGAALEDIPVVELAERNMDKYLQELKSLNVKPASKFPRATHEIESIINIIQGLIENGMAYAKGGDVYFRVRKKDDYGKLSNRKLEDLVAGARLEIDGEKEYPGDFALWKTYKNGEPFWESPWGKGRPGWHIECTAMSIEYLGESIDIHGGGLDLVFPHHENEIAQSESFTGVKPFARFWVHNGTLQYGSDKMSKSIGNVFSIGQALEKYSSDDLRMFFLNSHYRRPLTYSEEIVGNQSRAVERLRNALMATSGKGSQMECDIYEAKFCEAMDDDMNTPRALAVLFELAREINKGSSEGYGIDEAQEVLSVLAGVLGFTLMQPRQDSKGDIEPFVEILINTRIKLRESKLFEFADQIRDELLSQGVVLEDSVDGTDWKYLS